MHCAFITASIATAICKANNALTIVSFICSRGRLVVRGRGVGKVGPGGVGGGLKEGCRHRLFYVGSPASVCRRVEVGFDLNRVLRLCGPDAQTCVCGRLINANWLSYEGARSNGRREPRQIIFYLILFIWPNS